MASNNPTKASGNTNDAVFAELIAKTLNLRMEAVAGTLALLGEGCTIPFISRYRKERTGALDEVQIAAINDGVTEGQVPVTFSCHVRSFILCTTLNITCRCRRFL